MDHSGPPMSCILRLYTSPGWHKTLTKILKQIKDVSYTIDAMQEFAYISGDINTALLLKLIAKSGKHVELCQLDYGYNYNRTDYYSQKHQYNLQSHHKMASLQHQSLQDQTAPENSAPPTSTRPNKTKTNNSNCCLM